MLTQYIYFILGFMQCSSDESSPLIVCISKMFHVDLSSVIQTKSKLVKGKCFFYILNSPKRCLTVEEMKEKREKIINNLKSLETKPSEDQPLESNITLSI